jgi:hypothetical protein
MPPCLLTAFSETKNCWAMAVLDRPSAISVTTSRSRSVSRAIGASRECRASMAEGIVYEFTGVTSDHYAAVSRHLGIDPDTGVGAWPPGMLFHTAGVADDGTFIVQEVWSSRPDQQAFMDSRLASALAVNGVTAAPRVRWVPLVAHYRFDS